MHLGIMPAATSCAQQRPSNHTTPHNEAVELYYLRVSPPSVIDNRLHHPAFLDNNFLPPLLADSDNTSRTAHGIMSAAVTAGRHERGGMRTQSGMLVAQSNSEKSQRSTAARPACGSWVSTVACFERSWLWLAL
jgi:hypothetical protein